MNVGRVLAPCPATAVPRLAAVLGVAALLGVAAGLTGCALPPVPKPPDLGATVPLSGVAEGGQWPAADWWKRYGDPDLDRLVDLALEFSPTLATAHARLDTARQAVRVVGAQSGAHVEASGDGSRQRLSDHGLFPPDLLGFHWYDQFDLGLQAGYTFDWWGKQKAAVDSAVDDAHAAAADRAAAGLILASSVVDGYFGWQADQARLAIAREHAATVSRLHDIVMARIAAHVEAADAANAPVQQLAAVREQVAMLEGSARLQLVTLAALVGRSSAELPTLSAKPLPALRNAVPDDVTIDLMARRPDLVASRWRVEAAAKNRDAARADFFPDVSINALIGLQSRDLGKLLLYDSRVPGVSAAIHLPLFDAGRLKARYGAAQAAIDSAVAAYQETLVNAARDVATQVSARAQINAERTQRQIEVAAAERSEATSAARVRQGLTDLRPVLAATELWLDQRDALLQLDAAALSADVGLQRALGGGYERKEKPP